MATSGEVWLTPADQWRLQEQIAAAKSKHGSELDSFGVEEPAPLRGADAPPGRWDVGDTWSTAGRLVCEGWRTYAVLALVQVGAALLLRVCLPHRGTEALPWLLILAAVASVHVLVALRTAHCVRTGAPPAPHEALWQLLGALPRVLAAAAAVLLVAVLIGAAGEAVRTWSGLAGLLARAVLVGTAIRLGIFAVPAAAVDGRGPLGSLVSSMRATRRMVRVGLEMGALYFLNWVGSGVLLLVGALLMASARDLSPLLLVTAPVAIVLISLPNLMASTVWTLVYLREHERSSP